MHALTVHFYPVFYTTLGRTETRVEWRQGMTIRDAIGADWSERPSLWVIVNGARVIDLDTPVWSNDVLDVSERPADPFSLGLAAATTAAGAGASAAATAAGAFSWGALLGQFAIASFTAVVFSILGRQKQPKRRGDKESSAYSFSGPGNDRAEGQVREYSYGAPMIGGTVIAEFTRDTVSPPQTRLFQLRSLGEGPFHSIGGYTADNEPATPLSSDDPDNPIPDGMKFNGNDAKNFKGVKVHVRLGNQRQEPCPGFDEIHTPYDVGQRLRQEPTSSSNNFTLHAAVDPALVAWNADGGLPTSGESIAAQEVWTKHARALTTSEEHDGGRVVVSFPGLNAIDPTDGSLENAGFQLATRYKRVDSFGNPIDIGGDRGTGWVYPRPEVMFIAKEQRPFRLEYDITFYDPLTYTPPTIGECLNASTTSDYATTASLNTGDVPASWVPGQTPNAFTIEVWAKFDNLNDATGATSLANKSRALVSWWSGSSTTGAGVTFGIFAGEYQGPLATTVFKWVPSFIVGTNGGVVRTYEKDPDPTRSPPKHFIAPAPGSVTPYHHLVCTYAKDPTDQTGVAARYRLYLNGVLLRQFTSANSADQMAAPTAANPMEFARSIVNSGFNVAADAKAFMDEVVIQDRELTEAEVRDSYHGGQGTFHTSNANTVGLYHFESGAGTTDSSSYANTLTLNGGATAGTTTGHVWDTTGIGTPLVSRWLVQAMRLNLESDLTRIQDDSEWVFFYGRLASELAYPNLALVAVEIPATDQLNTGTPTATNQVKARLCPVWDGASVISPRITRTWSQNLAWGSLAIATEERTRRRFTYDRIDWPRWGEFADHCDDFLSDGKGYVQEIDSVSGTAPIADLKYDSTLFDDGGIELLFRPDFNVPPHWMVGSFVQLDGLPTHANIDVDIGLGGVQDAWEIGEIEYSSGGTIVRLIYSETTYGPPWTDGLDWTTVTNPQALSGTVYGVERRYQFDATFDTDGELWDVLKAALSGGRAAPILLEGDVLSVSWARPRSAVGMITKANTMVDVDGDGVATSSFEFEQVGTIGVPNRLQLTIVDRDRGFKPIPVKVPGPRPPTDPLEEIVTEKMELFGVTRRSQAFRWGKYWLKARKVLRGRARCRVGFDSFHYEAGSVVHIANDLMPWGKSGRLQSAPAANQVKLDRQITIPASPTTYITVRIGSRGQDDSGADHMETIAVSTVAGTYAAGTTLTLSGSFSTTPEKGDLWILYQTKQEMEIVAIKDVSPTVRELELVEYDEEVFDGVDELTTELNPGGMALSKG